MTSRTPSTQALGGRIVAGGRFTREALARMFRLDPERVVAAAWVDHALEVAISDAEGAAHVLRVEARATESQGLVLTEHLNFYFRGRDVPADVSLPLGEYVAEQLSSKTLDDLGAILADDPRLGHPGEPMPPGVDDGKRPRSLLDTWGESDSYADFFATGEISRSQLDSVFPTQLFRFVQHCDAECLQVNPHSPIPSMSLINFPWDDRIRRPFGPLPQREGDLESDSEGMVTTDLTEHDVIMGCGDKVRRVLEYAVHHPASKNRSIFFSNTCVPAVIGEDVESVVKQVERDSGKKIFYLTVTPRSMTMVYEGLLVTRRRAAEQVSPAPSARAINLIGYPDTRATRELTRLLASAGIEVNATFIPDIVVETVDRLPRAALNVVYPNRTWQHLYDQLALESRTPHIAPPAPYGFEGTHSWLRAVAEALHATDAIESAWRTHTLPLQERWEQLVARAARTRLGFVVREEETYYLTTPGTTWGVPLVSVLEEMGFGIDVLMKVNKPDSARDQARELRASFGKPERNTIRAFDSFEFLRHRLRESESAAFLTYQFFDWRLGEAGKGAFSIQHFEVGAAGAVRTLERLLGVCQTEFFSRYSRFLGRSREGLRLPPRSLP